MSYWRSLRELHGEQGVTEQKAHEFMAGVTDKFDPSELSAISRKQFLAMLTASAAFAAAGCTDYRDKGEIVPYTKRPEEVIPGIANYYASTCDACAQSCGILIKTREGRPVKVDGNPDHPINKGKTCAIGQAHILDLYDPARLRQPRGKENVPVRWSDVDVAVIDALRRASAAGKEIALISHAVHSPSVRRLFDDFKKKYPTASFYFYDVNNSEPRRTAWEALTGSAEIPVIRWEDANVILALESDFLGTEGITMEQIRSFASRRDIMKSPDFNRLYCVESAMSLTGANSDHRFRLRPDAQREFVLALLNEIATVRRVGAIPAEVKQFVESTSLKKFAARFELPLPQLMRLVDDLLRHPEKSLVVAGDVLPASVHAAVFVLNDILSARRLYAAETDVVYSRLSSSNAIETMVARMLSGAVAVIIHLDTNPVFHFPAAIGYEAALKNVPVSVCMSRGENETSSVCTYSLPLHHAYESWGDFHVRTGVYSFRQPVIAPLYDTRQKEAVLLTWLGTEHYSDSIYRQYLMKHWETEIFPALKRPVGFKSFWHAALHDGVIAVNEIAPPVKPFKIAAVAALPQPHVADGYTLLLTGSHYVGDGRFAGNGWLQELPHPISKIVWDNYAALAPMTAKELGVASNDMIQVTTVAGTQSLPVFVQPGMAEHVITMSMGYGRWHAGPIGTGVGTAVAPLLQKDTLMAGGVVPITGVKKTGVTYELVSTQEHHALDDAFLKDLHLKRNIICEGTVELYAKDPEFLHHERPQEMSITRNIEYAGVKWAMAIDLNKCVACNACVAGCNVENNIPVVGKDQVRRGREMQWIRIDRYYAGTPEAPTLSHQPMLCQHCDNAPCENVCPVVATTHSPDGLNQMTYNRCVGTKYCSNNCPYKVRRFNFYNFRHELSDGYYEQDPVGLVHNPEVTVRSRGVMEKCSFCVQRIMEARQHAAEQGRSLAGSDVHTACQAACPAEAIVFGDMNDPSSSVSHYRKHNLGYNVLEEVNARPNVTYVARLRNVDETPVNG
ncbi:MAG: Fe-S-cluster-containing hydrogenase [Ignavibacteriales bacterium]|nr:Fe-S-cluster-containing hydrogenase [Ignavibacteriales bacterium]